MAKIKVRPEGREDVWLCEKTDIINWLNVSDLDLIHNYICGPVLLGCDWEREDVVEKINDSEKIAILTGAVLKQNRRHALSVISDNKLYAFDIGEITRNDLDIEAQNG